MVKCRWARTVAEAWPGTRALCNASSLTPIQALSRSNHVGDTCRLSDFLEKHRAEHCGERSFRQMNGDRPDGQTQERIPDEPSSRQARCRSQCRHSDVTDDNRVWKSVTTRWLVRAGLAAMEHLRTIAERDIERLFKTGIAFHDRELLRSPSATGR